jgi:hypothetical protein
MRYEQTKSLRNAGFKRLCGVKRATFEVMRAVLSAAEAAKTKPGRPCKLGLEEQLLMTLLYWREYRTLFHLATTMGQPFTVKISLSEAQNHLIAGQPVAK